MTQIQDIAKSANLSDLTSARIATEKMKAVPDPELHLYLVMRDTLNATSSDTRKCIALAQYEADRRHRNEARQLAFRTTLISGAVGLIGVVVGAMLPLITGWLTR